jgi:hypothetical protein
MSATVWSKVLQFFPTLLKGNSGAAPSINWPAGSVQSITLNAATVTPTFVPTVGGANLALVITQDGVGGRAVTWPAAVSWIGGTPPILLSGASQTTLVNFYWDGTTYWGSLATAGSPASLLPWTNVAAGTTLAWSAQKPFLSFDSTGLQSTLNMPAAAALSDGLMFCARLTGTTTVTPVILNAGAGTTIEAVGGALGAGNFGTTAYLPYEAMQVTYKYDKATTSWKETALSLGSASAALNTTAWAVDYGAGDNKNSGAPGSPLAEVAEIRRRWNGGLAGVRPQLPAISVALTITGSPASAFSDPHSVLADIDAQPGFTLVVDSVPTIKRSGTVTSVPNAFARTPTGEQTITDGGVADWTSDVDHPLLDTTTSALTWVLSGVGTATINPSRGAQTAAAGEAADVLTNGLSAAAVAATNTYQILTLPAAYFGTGALFRMVPGGSNATRLATIQFRRFDYGAVSSADALQVEGEGRFIAPNSTGGLILFSECKAHQQIDSRESVIWANCAFLSTGNTLGCVFESPHVNGSVLCGYARCSVTAGPGQTIDQDFQIHGSFSFNSAFDDLVAGEAFFGNVGRFLDGGADKTALFVNESTISSIATYDAQAIFYGTTGTAAIARVVTAPSVPGGQLCSSQTAAITYVFNGGAAAFFQLGEQGNAFGFNEATGLWVGPTTATVGHLDAALGLGTGLGQCALWPRSSARIRVAP